MDVPKPMNRVEIVAAMRQIRVSIILAHYKDGSLFYKPFYRLPYLEIIM